METKTQKLEKRNTYTPIDASQVYGSVDLSLNKEETLSEQVLKTFSNNLDVNQQSGKTEQNMSVFVVNMRGEPSKGSHCNGSRVIIIFNGKNKSVSIKRLEVKSYGKGIVLSTRQFLTTLKDGVSLAQTLR